MAPTAFPHHPGVFVSWPGYRPDDPETGGRLVAAGCGLLLHPKLGSRTEAELSRLLGDAEAAIVSTDPFGAGIFSGHPKLRVVARVGVGTDSVDLAAASRHGVPVTVTPGLNADTVAEHAVALILALTRKVVTQDASVKAGKWERVGEMTPSELKGQTVGIVGAGAIGRGVSERLRPFGVRLVYFDPYVTSWPGADRLERLETLLAEADVVSIHAPLTPETAGLIGDRQLRRLKASAVLVNTSRGGLVDQPALLAALREGRLAGAALDVFETEPPPAEAFAGVPNLICSAHVGGLSHASIRRMTISATESVLAALAGEIPSTAVNAGDLIPRPAPDGAGSSGSGMT